MASVAAVDIAVFPRSTAVSISPPKSLMPLRARIRCCASNGAEKDPVPSSPQNEEVKDLGVRMALSMLKFYKREISPLMLPNCRYVPTCSEYSMQAYKKYGVAKGTILTAWRLCRCNPLGVVVGLIPHGGLVRINMTKAKLVEDIASCTSYDAVYGSRRIKDCRKIEGTAHCSKYTAVIILSDANRQSHLNMEYNVPEVAVSHVNYGSTPT